MKIEVWLLVVVALAFVGVFMCFGAFLSCWTYGGSVALFDMGLACLACVIPAMIGMKCAEKN